MSASRIKQFMGWPYRAFGALFAMADRVVPTTWLPALDAEALIAAAGVAPGDSAREGLERLLASLCSETELSLFGRLSVRWDMIRLLRNAARVEAAHRDNPALAAQNITAPIFILGLPRSGTSFLHSLLAADPENQVPRNWQTIYPAPRPAGFNPAVDASARMVDRQLRLFAGLAPGFAQLHPVTADSPQECSEITSHVFQSLRFDTVFRVPTYQAWLNAQGDVAAFRFHKLFLQFLQNATPSRWVLKCPDHTFSIEAILQIYPDARFVIVHRDPLDVLASNARLTEVMRRAFSRCVDPMEIGRLDSERWIDGAGRLLAFDRREDVPAARKIHLRHDALIAAPMAAVQAIYDRFGLVLSLPAQATMMAQLAASPRGGYAAHAPYSLAKFGLDAATLRARFAPYVAGYCEAAPAE